MGKKVVPGSAFDFSPRQSVFMSDGKFNGKNQKKSTMETIGVGPIDYRQAKPISKKKTIKSS